MSCRATDENTITLSVPKPRENDQSKHYKHAKQNEQVDPLLPFPQVRPEDKTLLIYIYIIYIYIYIYIRRLGPTRHLSLLDVPGLATADQGATLAPITLLPFSNTCLILRQRQRGNNSTDVCTYLFPPAATRRPIILSTAKSARQSHSLSNGKLDKGHKFCPNCSRLPQLNSNARNKSGLPSLSFLPCPATSFSFVHALGHGVQCGVGVQCGSVNLPKLSPSNKS